MHPMLLEQQNNHRPIMARRPLNNMGLSPSHLQPSLSGSLHPLLQNNELQDHEMQTNFPGVCSQQRYSGGMLAPVDRGQDSRSGLSQSASDNQTPLPVQRYEERPTDVRNFQDQPQPLTAPDPFAPLPAPAAEASGHRSNRSQATVLSDE